MSKLTDAIIAKAISYRNVEETTNNSGFKQPWFLKLMQAIGWQKYESWCAFAAKSVWYTSFLVEDPIGAALVKKYANGSCVQSYKNFANSKEFHVQQTPTLGALVYFQHGDKNSTTGHAGVVTEIKNDGFTFDSGNTSAAGSREGTTFLPKFRGLPSPFIANGLNIMGFVVPTRIA